MKRKEELIEEIKRDFRFVINKKEVEAVILYGSWSKNEQTERSDVDICIVAPSLKTPKQFANLLGEIWRRINANKYDVRIFEALPLYLKMGVIENGEIIFSRDKPELSYYFYHFRKLWNDQSVNWIEI